MIQNIPLDLRAEILLEYLPREMRLIEIKGSHKRNAYEDIAGFSDDNGNLSVAIARNGMYDILPESLFHPIDRFDNIPANEYKERFKEECELQQIEEENARKYFAPFDIFLMELSSIVAGCKNNDNYTSVVRDILTDCIPEEYRLNRFVMRTMPFIPHCHRIRGNKPLFTLMLRHILLEEGVTVNERWCEESFNDESPRYEYTISDNRQGKGSGIFLGNEFEEDITIHEITLWKEDECNESFLNFVSEMEIFENFLNDFFMGIETRLRFNLSTDSPPVRLADDIFYTYLDYNTNI